MGLLQRISVRNRNRLCMPVIALTFAIMPGIGGCVLPEQIEQHERAGSAGSAMILVLYQAEHMFPPLSQSTRQHAAAASERVLSRWATQTGEPTTFRQFLDMMRREVDARRRWTPAAADSETAVTRRLVDLYLREAAARENAPALGSLARECANKEVHDKAVAAMRPIIAKWDRDGNMKQLVRAWRDYARPEAEEPALRHLRALLVARKVCRLELALDSYRWNSAFKASMMTGRSGIEEKWIGPTRQKITDQRLEGVTAALKEASLWTHEPTGLAVEIIVTHRPAHEEVCSGSYDSSETRTATITPAGPKALSPDGVPVAGQWVPPSTTREVFIDLDGQRLGPLPVAVFGSSVGKTLDFNPVTR
ncbi:MAG: hypothetical protein PHU85_04275 [Phycisphaerae bacterium]|nr:hypothetical protein [Phycisphaerae bacterium]